MEESQGAWEKSLSAAPNAKNTPSHQARQRPSFLVIGKPKKDEDAANVSEQTLVCRSEACASEFVIYWYDVRAASI